MKEIWSLIAACLRKASHIGSRQLFGIRIVCDMLADVKSRIFMAQRAVFGRILIDIKHPDQPCIDNLLRSEVMLLRQIVALSLLVVSTMVTISTTAMADTIDVNLRDSSAQFQYKSSMGRNALGNTEFHLGVLYVDRNNLLGDFGVLVKDELGGNAPGFSVGVGIKVLVAKVRGDNPANSNASALALGGMVRYSPPATPRLGLVGEVYLSPNIVTFGDADRYVETVARMEYEVIPQSVAYLGYRRIAFGLNNQPYTVLDQGFNLGVRISF